MRFDRLILPTSEQAKELQCQIEEAVSQLDMPPNHAVIIGSAVLQLNGIRQARDIDVMVSPELANELQDDQKYSQTNTNYSNGKKGYSRWLRLADISFQPCSPGGVVTSKQLTALTDFTDNTFPITFSEAAANSDLHFGMPFLSLQKLYDWKLAMTDFRHGFKIRFRNEWYDKRDIALIEKYQGVDLSIR